MDCGLILFSLIFLIVALDVIRTEASMQRQFLYKLGRLKISLLSDPVRDPITQKVQDPAIYLSDFIARNFESGIYVKNDDFRRDVYEFCAQVDERDQDYDMIRTGCFVVFGTGFHDIDRVAIRERNLRQFIKAVGVELQNIAALPAEQRGGMENPIKAAGRKTNVDANLGQLVKTCLILRKYLTGKNPEQLNEKEQQIDLATKHILEKVRGGSGAGTSSA